MEKTLFWILVALPASLFSVRLSSSVRGSPQRFRRADDGIVCGGPAVVVNVIEGQEPGTLLSPNFPEFYPANTTCQWRLGAPQGKRINITATTFSLENSMGCVFDHVVIYDGTDKELGRFCGNSVFSLETISDTALVRFMSDISYEGIGFKLNYSIAKGPYQEKTPPKPDCNSTFTQGPGSITSPNFPLPPDHNTYCTYPIKAPEGKVVQLLFKFFHLELCRHCDCDYLQIFDGNDTEGDSEHRLCGRKLPPLIRSDGRDMLLVFRMDNIYRLHGFNVTYSFVEPGYDPLNTDEGDEDCSGVRKEAGILTSPGYPSYYPPNKLCVTVLEAPKGQYVQLDVRKFSVEGNSTNCVHDTLTIADPADVRNRQSYKLCGDNPTPRTVTSRSHILRLWFESDYSVTGEGYVLNYTFIARHGCDLPCENYGECILEGGIQVCECVPPFTGQLCQIRPRNCGQDPCQNGGTCDQHGLTYICTCRKGYGGDHCNIDMRKELAFETAPESQTDLKPRSPVTLTCQANRKTADISWKLNGETLTNSISGRLGIQILADGTVLHIRQTRQRNAGKYTCVAFDPPGEPITQDAWVTIAQSCDLKITQGPRNATERNGLQAHLFECQAESAHHEITYSWLKDGMPVEETARVKKVLNRVLEIRNVSYEDDGKYTCQVQDVAGCADSQWARLTVVGRGDIHEECGRPKLSFPGDISSPLRIVGGRQARTGAYPWFVAFYDTVKEKVYCGGTIVSEHWIVTAAHCLTAGGIFNRETTKLFAGTNKCRGMDGPQFTIDYTVTHEDYNEANFHNDIALVRVKESIDFSSSIQPLCIQSRSVIEAFIRQRSEAYVAGCGNLREGDYERPDRLMEIKLPIRTDKVCRESLRGTKYMMTESMICAGFLTRDTGDSCSGDSGGPLVANVTGQYSLVGIVSWGHGCDVEGQFGFYTNVAKFFRWIHDITQM